MRASSIIFVLTLATAVAAGQTIGFDCQAPGVFPLIGSTGDCEGVTATPSAEVTVNDSCGFPSGGLQFARIAASGPIAGFGVPHPASTPIARPASATIAEMRVPAPAGATSVALCFNFYNAEGPDQSLSNDGVEIAVVDAAGLVLAPVAYADTWTPLAPSGCLDSLSGAPESGASWPDTAVVFFPALPAGAYLSVTCWNSADDSVPCTATVDTIIWDGASAICPLQPPANDDCSGSAFIDVGTNPGPASTGNRFTNAVASLSPGWATNCSGVNITKDVWFHFTPGTSGVYQIDTETPASFAPGSITDTILEIHPPGCVVGTAIACDDDGGITGTGLLSLAYASLSAGVTYQIRIGAYALATVTEGSFYLNVAFVGTALANDDCGGGAPPLALGPNPSPAVSGLTFNNSGSTTTLAYPPECAGLLNDVWFSFTPATSDTYTFDTNTPCGFIPGTMIDTTIALYDASACGVPGAAMACDADSGVGSLSVLQAALSAGNTYHLRVGAVTSVFQTFYVSVRQGGLAPNDECAGAIALSLGTNPVPAASCNRFDDEGATTSAGWPPICATTVNDVWFSFTAPATESYLIDTSTPCGFGAGTVTNTTIALYASCTPGAPIACDADGGTGSLSSINPFLIGGTVYYLRVGVTAAPGTGTFYVNVNPGTMVPPNDTCGAPNTVMVGTNPAPGASCATYSNEFATTDAGFPPACGTIVKDVWFLFVPPTTGDFRIATETPNGFLPGSMTNSTVAIYPSGCAPGAPLACDADSGVTGAGFLSIMAANGLVAGTPYLIRVGSTSASSAGSFHLTISRVFSLTLSDPFGPGSLQVDIAAGPPSGTYFFCVTFLPGSFPAGFFFGIEPTLQEIGDQLNAGFPFVGPLNATGDMTLGPIGGAPSGLPLYAVALAFAGPLGVPSAASAPKHFVIP